MICNATSLGTFNQCDDIQIEALEGEIIVKNVTTEWQCTFPDGTIGKLAPGDYVIYADENYTLKVE